MDINTRLELTRLSNERDAATKAWETAEWTHKNDLEHEAVVSAHAACLAAIDRHVEALDRLVLSRADVEVLRMAKSDVIYTSGFGAVMTGEQSDARRDLSDAGLLYWRRVEGRTGNAYGWSISDAGKFALALANAKNG